MFPLLLFINHINFIFIFHVDRVRRDMSGLLDMFTGFFKSDDQGNSPLKSIMNSVVTAMGGTPKARR